MKTEESIYHRIKKVLSEFKRNDIEKEENAWRNVDERKRTNKQT